MTFQHHLKMLIINICDTQTTLFEQHPFTSCIFFETGMLVRTDMTVPGCKNADFKGNTGSPVLISPWEDTSMTQISQPASTICAKYS